MRALLKRPSPFAFPGGLPGFDPSHPAAMGTLFSGASSPGGSFTSILNGKPGTKNGTPTTSIFGAIGPQTSFLGNSDNATFAFPATAFSALTMAAIFTLSTVTGLAAYIMHNAAGGSTGIGTGIGASATLGLVCNNVGNANSLGSSVAISLGVPYFAAVSVFSSTLAVAVLKNLQTGQITTFTGAPPAAATAGDGNIYIGNRGTNTRQLGGGVAAAMWSSSFTNLPTLIAWAQDPWSFWYPQKLDLWSMLKVSSGAAVFNQTVNVTCASTVTMSRVIGKSIAVTCSGAVTRTQQTAKKIAVTCSGAVNLVKSIGKSIVATCASAVTRTQQTAKKIAVTCTGSVTLSAIRVFLVTISVNCSTSVAAIRKSVGKNIAVNVASTVTMSRAIAKSLAVTCTGTVNATKVIAKTIAVTCSSILSFIASFIGIGAMPIRQLNVTISAGSLSAAVGAGMINGTVKTGSLVASITE